MESLHLEDASFVTAAQSLSLSPTQLGHAKSPYTNTAEVSPPRKALNVRERLRIIVEKHKSMRSRDSGSYETPQKTP